MMNGLTSVFNHLFDLNRYTALVHLLGGLNSEGRTAGDETVSTRADVHGPLERITLPAEDVVSVLSEPGAVNSL
jgi:hypothetical protein